MSQADASVDLAAQRERATPLATLARVLDGDYREAGLIAALFAAAATSQAVGVVQAVGALTQAGIGVSARLWQLGIGIGFTLAFIGLARVGFMRWTSLCQRACDRILLDIAARIRDAEIASIERVGGEALLDGLTRDTAGLLDAMWAAISCVFSIVAVVLRLGFLLFVAPVAVATIAVVAAAAVPLLRRLGRVQAAREDGAAAADGVFLRLAEQLIAGFAWFRLDRRRRDDMLGRHLVPAMARVRLADAEAGRAFAGNRAAIDLVILAGIGAVAYCAGVEGTARQQFLVLALLLTSWTYVTDSLAIFPSLVRIGAAIGRLDAMAAGLGTAAAVPAPLTDFERIGYAGLAFSHRDAGGQGGFRLGPLDFEIRRGEILFIVGGNGSGKSTLTRVLTGLYPPEAGEIRVDGRIVAAARLRGLFGGVFSDFHLLARPLGAAGADPAPVGALLSRFGLARVTVLRDGRFSVRGLSAGQRKRLALVVAVMEGRPILLYDEWASDQDPEFRDHFYRVILPEQRAAGRTVVAVTHDDRYFDCADRIVTMEGGRVVSVRQQRASP